MTTVEFVLISVIAVAALWAVTFGQRLPKALRERACQGRAWRRAFPDAPKSEIREFLSIVASAFAFAQSQRLKLSPSDQLLQIYRSRYPVENWPDQLELETLHRHMRIRYGVDLVAEWNDQVTLGDLFGMVCGQRGNDA
jgi:hypothetical protein